MKKILIAILMLFAFTAVYAGDLGPNVKTQFWSMAPGVSVGSEDQPALAVDFRQVWHPVDLVIEGIARSAGTVNLMLAKDYGGNQLMAGAGVVRGNVGVVVGADINKFTLRLNLYGKDVTTCSHHSCSTSNKNRSELFAGYRLDI